MCYNKGIHLVTRNNIGGDYASRNYSEIMMEMSMPCQEDTLNMMRHWKRHLSENIKKKRTSEYTNVEEIHGIYSERQYR